MKTARVYWVRLPHHRDPFCEGYIGFTTKTAEKRFNEHFACATNRYGRSEKFERAIRKHGRSGLVIQTLCIGTPDYCFEIEKRLRPAHAIGWNLAVGGEKVAIGRVVSAETRRKLSASREGIKYAPEVCEKIRIRAMGNTRKLGVKLSDESRERIRKSRLGKKASMAARANMSAAHAGKKMPDSHREKTRARMLGYKHSAEAKAKMSAAKSLQKQCPYCAKTGGAAGMARWHFENCKVKQ